MNARVLATWLSLLLVIVALDGVPTRGARSTQPPPPPVSQDQPDQAAKPAAPDLWSPANPTAGGIVFLVNPADAQIYVDGGYAGRPLSFSPARPLRVGAGQHTVELVATGYETARLDVAVFGGFVTNLETEMVRR